MAEARVEEDEEGLRETREAAFRRTGFRPQDGSTDCTERHKPDRRSSSVSACVCARVRACVFFPSLPFAYYIFWVQHTPECSPLTSERSSPARRPSTICGFVAPLPRALRASRAHLVSQDSGETDLTGSARLPPPRRCQVAAVGKDGLRACSSSSVRRGSRSRERAEAPASARVARVFGGAAGQGPLSSIRAAIKKTTRTNPLSDHPRDRRRPEITIVSAEPLPTSPWFPGNPAGFPPPTPSSQPIWGGSISVSSQPPPSYDQVIKEKTREQVNPLGTTPLRSTTTTATQTELEPGPGAHLDPGLNVMSKALEKKGFNLRRPPKPPRPAFPSEIKPVPSGATVAPENSQGDKLSEERVEIDIHPIEVSDGLLDLGCQLPSDPPVSLPERSRVQPDLCEPCLISLDSPTELNEFSIPSSDASAFRPTGEENKRPVPRPRLKTPAAKEVKVQTLVRLTDDGENAQLTFNSGEVSTGRYLQELLDIFGPEEPHFPSQPGDQSERSEDMSTLRAKIQAFEKQSATSSEDGEVKKPEPRPRVQQPRPAAMAAKPTLAPKPTSKNIWEGGLPAGSSAGADGCKDVHSALSSSPRPVLPTPSTTETDGKEKRPSRPPVAPRAKTFQAKDKASAIESPAPLGQAGPMTDLISFSVDTSNLQPVPSHAHSEDTGSDCASYVPSKQDSNPPVVPRKPTLTRLPSRPGKPSEAEPSDPPPPLPTEKPVSGLPPPVAQKPSIASQATAAPRALESSQSEGFCSSLAGKSIPQRGKIPPPRPPPLKGTPGRPPPPRPAPCRSGPDSGPKDTSSQGSQKKGPALPPRPSPGHALLSRKTKEEVLIELGQSEGSAAERRAGEPKSPEAPSSVRIVSPAACGSAHLQAPVPGQGLKDSHGLHAEVLRDFTAGGPDELPLKAGDRVSMMQRVDGDWFRGTCRSASGIFPASHVKVLSSVPSAESGKTAKPTATLVSGPRCVARFAFAGDHGDELSLSEGDVVKLVEYVDREWARGELDGLVGIFPLNFVEIVQDLPAPAAQPSGVCGMTSSLKKQEAAEVSAVTGDPPGEWAVALYSFTAQTDEDLSFQQGEHILVTQHVDSDWCCGRLNGREGLFPKAFVQIPAGDKCGM
ncbi:SH3 domain-containing protein 19-like [Scleropages formosus]|uniref:SH3 domain-containing protein 19-like n=1 Tax=Scleropages formosus TaxID=113540 RepID=UPI0010FABDC1|nr:SH3 domain-containing protein 19-like [Scleropages formosus]